MPVLAKFSVDPPEELGYVLHKSMLGNKFISDIFHFFYTLHRMNENKFIEKFVSVSRDGGIYFMKMNETRYKQNSKGEWLTQRPYYVTDQRLDEILSQVNIWTDKEKRKAKSYYKDYHEVIAKTDRNL